MEKRGRDVAKSMAAVRAAIDTAELRSAVGHHLARVHGVTHTQEYIKWVALERESQRQLREIHVTLAMVECELAGVRADLARVQAEVDGAVDAARVRVGLLPIRGRFIALSADARQAVLSEPILAARLLEWEEERGLMSGRDITWVPADSDRMSDVIRLQDELITSCFREVRRGVSRVGFDDSDVGLGWWLDGYLRASGYELEDPEWSGSEKMYRYVSAQERIRRCSRSIAGIRDAGDDE